MAEIENITVDENNVYKMLIKIKNFGFKLEPGDPTCDECTFDLNQGTKWALRIYRNGDRPENVGHCSIYLCNLTESQPEIKATFKCGILHRLGFTKQDKALLAKPFKFNENSGWSKFISRRELFDYEKGVKTALVEKSVLSLPLEIQLHYEKPDDVQETNSEKAGVMKREFFSDLTVKVEGQTIKAHKYFLAEASGKFYEILKKSPNKKILELKNLDFETAERIINFIYDGKIDDIQDYAKTLYHTADQFEMPQLKKYCEESVLAGLTGENAMETVEFAIENDLDDLKWKSLEFLARHISEVPQIDWVPFIEESPDLFTKLFRDFVVCNFDKFKQHFSKKTFVKAKDLTVHFKERKEAEKLGFSLDDKQSNVKLKIGKNSLKAHKEVLSECSEYFRAMFEHDTKESQESQVTVEVCDAKIMKEVLKYIYTGRVYQLKKIAADLLKAANYYGLTELAGYCEQALMIELNMDNLPDMYEMAVTYNCPLLKERATTLLGKNILAHMKSEYWPKMIADNSEFCHAIFTDLIKDISNEILEAPSTSGQNRKGPGGKRTYKQAFHWAEDDFEDSDYSDYMYDLF